MSVTFNSPLSAPNCSARTQGVGDDDIEAAPGEDLAEVQAVEEEGPRRVRLVQRVHQVEQAALAGGRVGQLQPVLVGPEQSQRRLLRLELAVHQGFGRAEDDWLAVKRLDQTVAGHQLVIEVGQRPRLIERLVHHQRQPEAQLGDLDGLRLDVYAAERVADDGLFPAGDGFGSDGEAPGGGGAPLQPEDLVQHADQKRAGADGGVEHSHGGQRGVGGGGLFGRQGGFGVGVEQGVGGLTGERAALVEIPGQPLLSHFRPNEGRFAVRRTRNRRNDLHRNVRHLD